MFLDLMRTIALTVGDSPSGSGAGDAAGNAGGGGGGTWMLIIYVVIIAAMFFFMHRSQKKKDKKKQDMLNSIKKGDKVTTIGGIQGRVSTIKDDAVVIDVATVNGTEKVSIEVKRWGIGSVEGQESAD